MKGGGVVMRWQSAVLIVLAFLAIAVGQAGAEAAGQAGKMAPPMSDGGIGPRDISVWSDPQ